MGGCGLWQVARAAQLAAKGANNASKTPSATTREALEIECQKALLTIALDSLDKTPVERTELGRLFLQNLQNLQTTTDQPDDLRLGIVNDDFCLLGGMKIAH